MSVLGLSCLITSFPIQKPRFQSTTKNPKAFRREHNHKEPGTPQNSQPDSMSGSEGNGNPNPRIPLGLSLEQARVLGRGNAIHQLQQNYQALSAEVTQLTTDLREVLNHLREDPGGGGRRRSPLSPRTDPHSVHSSSSHEMNPQGEEGDHQDRRRMI